MLHLSKSNGAIAPLFKNGINYPAINYNQIFLLAGKENPPN